MSNSILRITDGTTKIDLLNLNGWLLRDWKPAVPEPKGGGVFRSSPLVDGRRLASKRMDNAIDTFNLVGSGANQNNMIHTIQELQRLMEKATNYWITDWQNEPVWIEARASCEDEIRYAVVVDYSLTGFGGPFQQPFFNAANMVATEAILAIEHLAWQSTEPGADGTCVQISSAREYPEIGTVGSGTFTPSQNSDDVTANLALKTISTGSNIAFGYSTYNYCAGILFSNVTIPAGATITKAYMKLRASNNDNDMGDLYILAQSQSGGNPATFDTSYYDFIERNELIDTITVSWRNPAQTGWTSGSDYYTPSLVEMIQRQVDASQWASGNNIVLFIYKVGPTGTYLTAQAYDDAGTNEPELYVEWSTETGIALGRSATCDNEVYVANKHNIAPITHVFAYDASGTSWSANKIGNTTYPYDIFPAVPAVGDIVYFGSATAYDNSGPFYTIVLDLALGQTDLPGLTWSYSTGAGTWTTLTVCGNRSFDGTGVSIITFAPVENWAAATYNGVAAYWIKCEVTVGVGAAPDSPQQQNRDIYTVVNPFVDIDAAQVGGDIPAISRLILDFGACQARPISTVTAALRSIDRGADFTPYFNCSDEQHQPGITFTGDDTAATAATEAPTGKNLDCSSITNATLSSICRWQINSSTSSQYPGVYHAWVRVRQTSGDAGDVKFRLRSIFGTGYNVSYSDVGVTSALNKVIAIDLGQLVIQSPYAARSSDDIAFINIILDAFNENGENFEVYDVILMPADEWIGTFSTLPDGDVAITMYDGKRLDIDGITVPRSVRTMQSSIIDDDSGTIDAKLSYAASSQPILQANKDQRVWFFQTYDDTLESYIEATCCVRIEHANRYILMRGDR